MKEAGMGAKPVPASFLHDKISIFLLYKKINTFLDFFI